MFPIDGIGFVWSSGSVQVDQSSNSIDWLCRSRSIECAKTLHVMYSKWC